MTVSMFELATNYAAGKRDGHSTNELNNRLVVVGGYNGTSYFGDIWHSPDGVNFTKAAWETAMIGPVRAYHATCVLDGRLYVTGGYNSGDGALSDCWMSQDGEKWNRVSNGNFTARYGHAMFSFDQRLWIVGGTTGNTTPHDVWCSYDGATWKKICTGTNDAPLGLYAMGYATYDGRMYMAGGMDINGNLSQNVYCSVNGMDWVHGEVPADFPKVQGCTLTEFDKKLVLIGGSSSSRASGATQGVWYSEHGGRWVNAGNSGFNVVDHSACALTKIQRLFVLGGYNGTDYEGRIWQTIGCRFSNRAW